MHHLSMLTNNCQKLDVVINAVIFVMIRLHFLPFHLRKRMNRRMNGIYLGLFLNFSLMGFFGAFFFSLPRTYWGYTTSWVCFCCNLFKVDPHFGLKWLDYDSNYVGLCLFDVCVVGYLHLEVFLSVCDSAIRL